MLKTPIYLSTTLQCTENRQKAMKAIVFLIIFLESLFLDFRRFTQKAIIFFKKAIVQFYLEDQPIEPKSNKSNKSNIYNIYVCSKKIS
jgi:hypothetical protein